jgi:type I restriction enzyme M protein
MMVELMQPKPEDVICDPACGTSGFLVTAGEYLKETRKEDIFCCKTSDKAVAVGYCLHR